MTVAKSTDRLAPAVRPEAPLFELEEEEPAAGAEVPVEVPVILEERFELVGTDWVELLLELVDELLRLALVELPVDTPVECGPFAIHSSLVPAAV